MEKREVVATLKFTKEGWKDFLQKLEKRLKEREYEPILENIERWFEEEIEENINNPQKLEELVRREVPRMIWDELEGFFKVDIRMYPQYMESIEDIPLHFYIEELIIEEDSKLIKIDSPETFANYVYPQIDIEGLVNLYVEEFDIYRGIYNR